MPQVRPCAYAWRGRARPVPQGGGCPEEGDKPPTAPMLHHCDWQEYRWLCSWTARKPISHASSGKICALSGNNGLDGLVFSVHGRSTALNGRYKYPKPLVPSAACRCDHAFGIAGLHRAVRAIFMGPDDPICVPLTKDECRRHVRQGKGLYGRHRLRGSLHH